ncbi:hypothetical protein [Vulgatibacter sp.]|uniref:hypothetical protein n=1 Tax=Vulgatibacter sp. TaxID=1971226 RepID=UPI003565E187
MKRWLVAGLAVAALAGCRGESGKEAAPGETEALITVGGVVTEAQPDGLTLRTANGEVVEMRIAEGAQVMLGGREVPASTIREGASVRASFREEEGENVARRVDIDRAEPAPTPTPSATPGSQGPAGTQQPAR